METITAVKKLIKPDLHLWVAVSGTQRLFFTKVSDVYDTSFTILPPTDNGENLIVTKKTELKFMFIIESGKYFFTTKPIGIIKDNITLLAIELPVSIQRNEMRAFYRVEMLRRIPVKLVHAAAGFKGTDYQKNDIVTMTCTDLIILSLADSVKDVNIIPTAWPSSSTPIYLITFAPTFSRSSTRPLKSISNSSSLSKGTGLINFIPPPERSVQVIVTISFFW